MTETEKQKYIDYIYSLPHPAENSYLSKPVVEKLQQEKLKLENTAKLIPTILGYDDFEERLQRATVEDRIFNPSQYANVLAKMNALSQGEGERIDIQESLVSPTGQQIIMSGRLQELLGFATDGYMFKDEADELLGALQADGVPGPQVEKVNSAINKYGAISLQRGMYAVLKSAIEESIGHQLALYTPGADPVVLPPQPEDSVVEAATEALPVPPVAPKPEPAPTPQPAVRKPLSSYTQDELPFGFIEYLKNTDKNFDRVENDLLRDSKFLEFFHQLQSNNKFYKSMTAERMAHEVMIRPPLWIKLSDDVQHNVAEMVERNRGPFSAKISEIADVAGLSKLKELKQGIK